MATVTTIVSTSCPLCDGDPIDAGGEILCQECDLVIEDTPVDHGPDWRVRPDGRGPRAGAPRTPTLHDNGIGTTLSGRNWTDVIDGVSPTYRRSWHAMQREHCRARMPSKVDRNRVQGLARIRSIASSLDLPTTAFERACTIFRDAHDSGVAMGRTLELIEAGAVLIACREHGRPEIADDLVDLTPADDRHAILRAMRLVADAAGVQPPIARPMQYIERLLCAVDAPTSMRRSARILCHHVEAETDIAVGRQPICVAGGIVRAVSDGYPIRQTAIADAAHCSSNTIREIADAIKADDAVADVISTASGGDVI